MSNKKIPPAPKNKTYGKIGASFSNKDMKDKFSKSNMKTGSRGEQILGHKLRKMWLPSEIPLFSSLIAHPKYRSDIDFAICQGDRILLIDAKLYGQQGGFFWSKGNDNKVYRNFEPYRSYSKNGNGNIVTMSKSMIMAKEVLSKKLPNHKVEAIVILTSDHAHASWKQPNTWFLKFPGNIKAYNDSSGRRFIKRFFFGQKRTEQTLKAEAILKSMLQ